MSLPQVPLMATVKGLVAGYYWLGSRLITRSCPVMTGVASVPKYKLSRSVIDRWQLNGGKPCGLVYCDHIRDIRSLTVAFQTF